MVISIFIYTTLLLIGGVMGYVKAGSVMSLVMGVVFSLFLTIFVIQFKQGKSWAGQCLLLTVLILDGFFSVRYIKTQALMPAGLFTVLSSILLVIIYLSTKKSLRSR